MIAEARRESQFAVPYLELNDKLGYHRGLTIGTFIAKQGISQNYRKSYESSLFNAMERRVAEGTAIKLKSIRGGDAYYSAVQVADMFPPDFDVPLPESIVKALLGH